MRRRPRQGTFRDVAGVDEAVCGFEELTEIKDSWEGEPQEVPRRSPRGSTRGCCSMGAWSGQDAASLRWPARRESPSSRLRLGSVRDVSGHVGARACVTSAKQAKQKLDRIIYDEIGRRRRATGPPASAAGRRARADA